MSRRPPYPVNEAAENAPTYWRSLDELADREAYQEKVAQEFPAGASELNDPVSRRTFMGLMGASFALAGIEGCARRPVERIVPYTRPPEGVIPGIPQHYATVMDINREALGLIVESHTGRPTKIEGNPEHPASLGGADMYAQASILELYDPDRSHGPAHRGGSAVHERTYADFHEALTERVHSHEADQGEGLRVLAEPTNSPTFMRLRDAVMRRFPRARFHSWSALDASNVRRGSMMAFGRPVNTHNAYDRARVILSLDSDFLLTEPGSVRATRLYANGRRLRSASDEMSRLYVVESTYSLTGANADHRLRLASQDVIRYLGALMNELATTHHKNFGPITAHLARLGRPTVPDRWITAVASDLAHSEGNTIVVAGNRQPPLVHALVHALNDALGNVGHTVTYNAVADTSEPDDLGADLSTLTQAMSGRQVRTLLVLGGNPAYDAPGSIDFGAALANVEFSVHLSSQRNETTERCVWHAPRTHELEAWGDHRSLDGTIGVQQPLISPLFNGHSDIEIFAVLANDADRSGHDLVRTTMRGGGAPESAVAALPQQNGVLAAIAGSERDWRRALHRGFITNTAFGAANASLRSDEIATQLQSRSGDPRALGSGNFEVVFAADNKMLDGRFSNVTWMYETADPITKVVWENVAYLSPATATQMSVRNGDVLRISKGNKSIEIPAWIQAGHADGSVTLPLGWGRRAQAIWVGRDKGVDVSPLRSHESLGFADGFAVTKVGRNVDVVQTQDHHAMENRPIAIEAPLSEYRDVPNFAERLSPTPRTLPLWREVDYSQGYKWGMVIDLNACTGCTACMVACQSENNIPVVGKDQVSRGREMAWLRIDRYFLGDPTNPQSTFQPLGCVQCEEAPCENVCPVAATTHTPEGLNDMAYNRCIGTRYCANNCPYKVRRFNYLNWHNDGVWRGNGVVNLTHDVPETVRMQHNPNVSVRFRGVMEKCTYCVQRIQMAKIAARRENRPVRDGEIATACEQSCPADAITFGNLNDRNSRVAQLARLDRRYLLLAEIGTQPRTTYLAKVRNPNPEMQG